MIKFEFTKDASQEVVKLGLPVRKTAGSAGYDFVTPIDIIVYPGHIIKIPTYIKAIMPKGVVLMLYVRSSIGMKRGLVLPNGTGVIDSDYAGNPDNDGNIIGALVNTSPRVQYIKRGETFMQGIFLPYLVTDNDDADGVRVGGIGSTNHAESE